MLRRSLHFDFECDGVLFRRCILLVSSLVTNHSILSTLRKAVGRNPSRHCPSARDERSIFLIGIWLASTRGRVALEVQTHHLMSFRPSASDIMRGPSTLSVFERPVTPRTPPQKPVFYHATTETPQRSASLALPRLLLLRPTDPSRVCSFYRGSRKSTPEEQAGKKMKAAASKPAAEAAKTRGYGSQASITVRILTTRDRPHQTCKSATQLPPGFHASEA